MQIRAEIWVSALIRRAEIGGAFAAVAAKGDPDAGSVIVKVALMDGRARLYAPSVTIDGDRLWTDPLGREAPAPESECDAYIARARTRDPDLWVVEIEDRAGRSFIA